MLSPLGDNSCTLLDIPASQEGIYLIQAQGSSFGSGFECCGQQADFIGAQMHAQLGCALTDGVTPGVARADVEATVQAEVVGIERFVGTRVAQNGPGVDTGSMGEGTGRGDRHVERDVDLQTIRYVVVERGELAKIVALKQFGIMD